jgi:phosphatidylserine/phosphatidylglycerophosphate/cardiolipin synthase-like enzyme
MYFGMSTFTYNSNATQLVTKYGAGVYVAGIDDISASSASVNSILTSGLGSKFIVYSGPDLYHNKFLIVDPSNTCSDPLVLTGSHNWTFSADTKNDENTLIIHDDTAANIYYQSFFANFLALGGTLSAVTGCPTGIEEATSEPDMLLTPNPSTGEFTVHFEKGITNSTRIDVYNMQGQLILQPLSLGKENYGIDHHFSIATPGTYVVRLITENGSISKLISVLP